MNCANRFPQLKGTYEIERKSKKWWHRIFWCYIDASVVNVYVIYREMNLPRLSLKDFRRDRYRDFVRTVHLFVTSRNKCQTTSRSVYIKNKKPYVPQKRPGEFCPPARKMHEMLMCCLQHKSNPD
ncbi:hypothetical protein TNCT_666761 [Trichonephila clavata]|uniref:PiggyBac transposable element-derived protein domain-containing protein n=1 Tax=Trichonephila clavata TaxID=2740835 RepID=A0A8X6JM11_TRICU|nr:hypothetical protein TNCT_666761 [Trichonephila clavata]